MSAAGPTPGESQYALLLAGACQARARDRDYHHYLHGMA